MICELRFSWPLPLKLTDCSNGLGSYVLCTLTFVLDSAVCDPKKRSVPELSYVSAYSHMLLCDFVICDMLYDSARGPITFAAVIE